MACLAVNKSTQRQNKINIEIQIKLINKHQPQAKKKHVINQNNLGLVTTNINPIRSDKDNIITLLVRVCVRDQNGIKF